MTVYISIQIRNVNKSENIGLTERMSPKICVILGYYAAYSGNSLWTFRDNVSAQFPSFKQISLTLRWKPEMSPVWHFVCFWRDSPQWTGASSFTRFLDHTRGEFRPRQTRQLPRAVDLKGRLLSRQSY